MIRVDPFDIKESAFIETLFISRAALGTLI